MMVGAALAPFGKRETLRDEPNDAAEANAARLSI
jgi:hypothetical protein